MREGDKVVCISENFPLWKTTNEDKSILGSHPNSHPKKDEVLIVDEVLGDFLRFDKYDTEEDFKWWKSDRFKKIDDIEEEYMEEKNTVNHVIQLPL